MAKRITLAAVYQGLLHLAEAVNTMSRDNERQFAGINRRLDDNDRHFLTIDRRLTNLEDGQSELRMEMRKGFGEMNERFDGLEQRVTAVEG